MPHINLLPWREKKRKEQEKQFYLKLGLAATLAVVTVFISQNQVGNIVNSQVQRNNFLTTQLNSVDQQIATINTLEAKKNQLLSRMNIIQRLQASRPESIHLFEQLVHVTPDGARLLSVNYDGGLFSVQGVADSNSLISRMMRNIDRSQWLQEPELIVIDSSKKEYPGASWFTLRFKKAAHSDPGKK